jgi:nicotinamidase-related amidase
VETLTDSVLFFMHIIFTSGRRLKAAQRSAKCLIDSGRGEGSAAYGCLTSFAHSAFGRALAQTGRSSVLLCGHWLEEYITFAAIKALSEGYDAYILADASPTRDGNAREMALLRLVQAGVVPMTTRQVIREWAADLSDTTYMIRLLALL